MQQITATRPSYYRPAPKPEPRVAKLIPHPRGFGIAMNG